MPGLLAALPTIISAISAGAGAGALGLGIANSVSKPPAAPPTAPTTPAAPTGPTSAQLTTGANTQYSTSGGVSPDYLQSLLAGENLAPQTGAASGLSGFIGG